MDEPTARRVVGEAAKFVAAGAQYDLPLAPSRTVDEGWHALILHTALYRDLCARHGRFVDHHPGYDPTHYDPAILDRTRAAIEQAGYTVDPELWRAPDDGAVPVARSASTRRSARSGPCRHRSRPSRRARRVCRTRGKEG
ncbi:hypothetical protein [Streptomyces sp. Z26]|uniref:hypothetical protein n=1 Tax=Streptomyces sp. Z26 TaxID=2500177 RepID=UPI001F0B7555|nr:hypothetical protein [Streptomyces sp. Z26]